MFSPSVLIPLSCKKERKSIRFGKEEPNQDLGVVFVCVFHFLKTRIPLKREALSEDDVNVSEQSLLPLSQNPRRSHCLPQSLHW